jgi:5-methylcytosine-specific restriction endonuclease McrA
MKQYICKQAGCMAILETPGYCPNHKPPERKPFENAVRYNQNLHKTARWRDLRKRILEDQWYCQRCHATTRLEVHHIKRAKGDPDLFFDQSNLVVLCADCHKLFTQAETRRGGQKK